MSNQSHSDVRDQFVTVWLAIRKDEHNLQLRLYWANQRKLRVRSYLISTDLTNLV